MCYPFMMHECIYTAPWTSFFFLDISIFGLLFCGNSSREHKLGINHQSTTSVTVKLLRIPPLWAEDIAMLLLRQPAATQPPNTLNSVCPCLLNHGQILCPPCWRRVTTFSTKQDLLPKELATDQPTNVQNYVYRCTLRPRPVASPTSRPVQP